MALDDLLKGLAVFDKGMTDLAVSQGVGDANEQLSLIKQQIQTGELKDEEGQQQYNEVANDLAMRLTQAGASPGQIAQSGKFGLNAAQQATQKQRQAEFGFQQQKAQEQTRQFEKSLSLQAAGMQAQQMAALQKQKISRAKLEAPGFELTGTTIPSIGDRKMVITASSEARKLMPKLNQLKALFAQEGAETGGANAKRMKSLATQIQLSLKSEAFANLGVLTGPDLDLLEDIIKAPTGFSGGTTWNSSIMAQYDTLGASTSKDLRSQAIARGYDIKQGTELHKLSTISSLPFKASQEFDRVAPKFEDNPVKYNTLLLAIQNPEHPGAQKILKKAGFDLTTFEGEK